MKYEHIMTIQYIQQPIFISFFLPHIHLKYSKKQVCNDDHNERCTEVLDFDIGMNEQVFNQDSKSMMIQSICPMFLLEEVCRIAKA